MTRTRVWACSAGTALALLLAGCDSGASDSAGAAAGTGEGAKAGYGCAAARGRTVAYSEPLADANFAAIEAVLKKSLGVYGVKVAAVNAGQDPGKQNADLRSLLQQQPAALVVNPVDPNAVQPVLAQFRARRIPLVAQDTKIGGPYDVTVREDVAGAAAEGAKLLRKVVGDGQVAAVFGPPYAELLNWEKEGFLEGAKQSGLRVVDQAVNQKITPAGAQQLAQAWKQKYGSALKGIWTFNDTSATGVAATFGGGFQPALVSLNGQPEAIPLVRDGKIRATYSVPYEKTGQALAYAALAAICGKDVPEEIVVPVSLLDRDNVDTWKPVRERVDAPFEVTLEQRAGTTYIRADG